MRLKIGERGFGIKRLFLGLHLQRHSLFHLFLPPEHEENVNCRTDATPFCLIYSVSYYKVFGDAHQGPLVTIILPLRLKVATVIVKYDSLNAPLNT